MKVVKEYFFVNAKRVISLYTFVKKEKKKSFHSSSSHAVPLSNFFRGYAQKYTYRL